MDATTVGVLGTAATVGAVILAHVLSERSGEKRANHVRDELIARITSLDNRISEIKSDLVRSVQDVRADSAKQASDVRAEITHGTERVEARMGALKEIFSLELKNLKMEILGALPVSAKHVGSSNENQV